MATRPEENGTSGASVPSILVIQPDELVPLGRFAEWLTQYGAEVTVVQPFAGDDVPAQLDADGLIVLGGTMTAHSLQQFPWLADIKALYHRAAEANAPALGICLGAQLLTVAFDGEVTSNAPAGPEIGVVDIAWTPASADDAMTKDIPQSFGATSFHYDGISVLPEGAVLLGRGDRYEHQVFRLGNTVGVQFHPEATPELFNTWCAADVVDKPDMTEFFEQTMQQLKRADGEIATNAATLARNFVAALRSAPRVQRH